MAAVQSQFALSVREWVERTKANADQACRKIALEIATRVILKTPVGNPELWKANAEAALQRSQHNLASDQINSYLAQDANNLTAGGRAKRKLLDAGLIGSQIGAFRVTDLKRSVRSRANRRLSKSELAKAYPFKQGQGYVGGRLRANWFVTIGTTSTATTDQVDPSGAQAIAAAQAALSSFKAGSDIYIVNNLPYAVPIEYGHSTKQAPAGVVRVTLAEVDAIVNKAAQEVAT